MQKNRPSSPCRLPLRGNLRQRYLLLLLLLYLPACVPDAPRNNPLDSLSSGSIQGWAFSFYQPRTPLSNVRITLQPPGRFVLTNADGHYIFSDIPAGAYQAIAERPGFRPDTLQINLPVETMLDNQNLILNGLPGITSFSYFSRNIDTTIPGRFVEAVINLRAFDPDGEFDIDSLILEVPDIALRRAARRSGPASFELIIRDTDPPFELSLIPLVEKSAFLTLSDLPGSRVRFGPFSLRRIIDDIPLQLLPVQADTAGARPRFSWHSFSAGFSYRFNLEVVRLNLGLPADRFLVNNIPADSLAISWPDTLAELAPGRYEWTIGVQDNIGNFSRSRERFLIIDGSRQ